MLLVEQQIANDVRSAGLNIAAQHDLKGLDLSLFKILVPEDADFAEFSLTIAEQFEGMQAGANHIYFAQQAKAASITDCTPMACAKAIGWMEDFNHPIRIGIIDTAIDTDHPALMHTAITKEDFARYPDHKTMDHGTAIASILAGNQPGLYKGLAPAAHIFAANVFSRRSHQASSEALLLAIDWMVENKVSVVNLSLAGPPDAVLERAIIRARERGTQIAAAVGNDGPAAPVMYPAAYGSVIAVTAIDTHNSIYRRAVRGRHINFAAPGVRVLAAIPGGAYGPVTGTSIAVPFISALLAAYGADAQSVQALEREAKDLGAKGFDPVYGFGLARRIIQDDNNKEN